MIPSKKRGIVALAAACALAGIVLWLASGTRTGGTGGDPGVASVPDPRAAGTGVEASGERSASRPESAAVDRTAVQPFGSAGSDPEFAAALAGFTGRLVTHDKQPAADRKVQIWRFDVGSVAIEGLRPDAEQVLEPSIDAGEATTGSDGRFTIRGAWPRALYLLIAAAGADDQTHQIVERSPGPGETVDLGDIELEWAATVTGRVVRGDGEPAKGAYVRAIDVPGIVTGVVRLEYFVPGECAIVGEGKELAVVELPAWLEKKIALLPLAATRTDDEGKFRLGGVRAGANLFTVTAEGALGFVNPALRVKAGQQKDLGTIRLTEGETVQGRVVDSKGTPIAGAEVVVAPKAVGGPFHFARRIRPSDADGRFGATGLPAGMALFAARRDPTYPWTITEPQPVASDVVITVPRSSTLTLRLATKDGARVPSPKIRLVPGPMGQVGVGLAYFGLAPRLALDRRLETLDDGAIVIKDLLPGKYSVLVTAAGFAPAQAEVTLESDLTKTLELEALKMLRLLVVDQKDKPVARTIVHVEETPSRMDVPFCAGSTGSDGVVMIPFAAGSTDLKLHAQHPRFGVAKHEVTLPATESKLVLLEPGSVVGDLEEDGRPPQLGKWTIIVQQQDGSDALPRFATADAGGRFFVRGLQPGAYNATAIPTLRSLRSIGSAVTAAMTLSLDAFGDTKSVAFSVRSGEVEQVRLVVGKKADEPEGPAGTLHGTVFVDGKAGVGMIVHCAVSRGRGMMVDERGGFDFGRVAAGEATLSVTDPNPDHVESGGLPIQQLWEQKVEIKDGGDATVDIQIRTTKVSGRVLRGDSAPVAGAFVTVQGPAQRFVTTDVEGRFELTRLAEGEYRLRAEHQEHGHGAVSKVQALAGQPLSGVEIRLAPYVTVRGRVDLGQAGITKHGSVYVVLEPVRPEDEHHVASGEADSAGTFTLERVVPGTYKAKIYVSSSEPSTGELEHQGQVQVGERGLEGLVLVAKPVAPPKEKEGDKETSKEK